MLTLGETLILCLLALLCIYEIMRDWIRADDERRRKKWRMFKGDL